MSRTLEESGRVESRLPEAVLGTLNAALVETLASICSAPPRLGAGAATEGEQVLALISLTGDSPLSLTIGVPAGTAPGLSESFAGCPFEFDSEDMDDLVGEVANLVAGRAKAGLAEIGIETGLSLPTVIRGQALRLGFRAPSAVHRFVYSLPEGEFVFQVVTADMEQLESIGPGSGR